MPENTGPWRATRGPTRRQAPRPQCGADVPGGCRDGSQGTRKAWKNAKHGDQWINTLKTYAYPALGDRRVDQIETPDILKALSPIWLTKQETARRVRQRIGTVLDWAKAAGFRSGNNPVEEISKALPRQSDRKGHHAALPYVDVPAFVQNFAGTIRRSRIWPSNS